MNEELENLQDKFAFVDLMTKEGKVGLLEVLLKKMLPLEFRMEPDNHHLIYILTMEKKNIKQVIA